MKNTASTINRFTKVKLGTASLNLAAVALLTAMLGLSLAACDSNSPANNTEPAPKAEKVTINVPDLIKDGEFYPLGAGAGIDFSITVEPAGASKAVDWSVDAASTTKATISTAGKLLLTAAAALNDEITVTATTKDGTDLVDEIKIKVETATKPIAITITPTAVTVAPGATVQFSVTAVDPKYASRLVTWEGSGLGSFADPNKGELTINPNATAGTMPVSAKSTADTTISSASATVTVVVNSTGKSITITMTELIALIGETVGVALIPPGEPFSPNSDSVIIANATGGGAVKITGSSASLTFIADAKNYDVYLAIFDGEEMGDVKKLYKAPNKHIANGASLNFGDFTEVTD